MSNHLVSNFSALVDDRITTINASRIKVMSPFLVAYAAFILLTDFVFQGVWSDEYLPFYRILDVVFAAISIFSVYCFWIPKPTSCSHRRLIVRGLPFVVLVWSAIITGIEVNNLGVSTFILTLLAIVFLLYINIKLSLLYFLGSGGALLLSITLFGHLNRDVIPLLFMLLPVFAFAILISWQNHKNKVNDIISTEKILDLNTELQQIKDGLEDEVEHRTHELLIAKQKAEESDKLKTAFLQNMSHEIRTPLNSICGFSEMIQSTVQDEQIKTFSSIVLSSSNQLLSIVNDILTISAIETGQEELNLTEVDICDLIFQLEKVFVQQVGVKDVAVSAHIPNNHQNTIIKADKTKLRQVLSNLLSNAVKFTPSGSIAFGFVEEGEELTFFVKDTGIGIDKNKFNVIFSRFAQADETIQSVFGGTGLGLSISKGFVELMGGRIWLESEVGKGTDFYFTIPYIPLVKEKIEGLGLIHENRSNQNISILVAEDEEFNFFFLKELLTMWNFNVLHARNGQETVEMCKSNSNIRLVLMDIRMPVMNGYDAAKEIRAINPDIPIVAQTAYALVHERIKYGNAFDDYITKPIPKEKLAELFQRLKLL
ncbi:MAG: ATP-binding protein [Tenuifilaceae bacterium]|nr:ATP-binding protein [Tenuifilaceae bacterium]